MNRSFQYGSRFFELYCTGEDVTPGKPEWDIFIKEVRKEMTMKAGQKCTAIRRIFVPENKMEDVWKAMSHSLSQTTIGNPLNEKVRMGSLAGQGQRIEVKATGRKIIGFFTNYLWFAG